MGVTLSQQKLNNIFNIGISVDKTCTLWHIITQNTVIAEH